MYKNRRTLALIPARGGSKGLPNKNIKPLLEKPLIGWTIEQAIKSNYVDEIFVTTNDKIIAGISETFGVHAYPLRPCKLASDTSKVVDTMLYVLKMFEGKGKVFDYLLLLEPTSPLRRRDDIDNAIQKLIDNEETADSLVSVGEIALEHPIYAKRIDQEGYVQCYQEAKDSSMLRQNLPKAFFPYGVVYLSKVETVRKYNAAYAGRILPLLIERWQNYEINDIYDFACVEAILSLKMGEEV
jgi:CMP-N,N'-diacetyllegionaminic acid synthase